MFNRTSLKSSGAYITKKLFWIVTFILVSFCTYSEGTKELRPSESHRASLHLSKKSQFTRFGLYGAAPEQQIKIRVASPDETIFLGLNTRNEDGDFVENIEYRVISPSGTPIYTSLINKAGEGTISSWSQAIAGPQELGNTEGYDALEIPVSETGDFIIEFNIDDLPDDDDEVQIHLFDITVASPEKEPELGRLHSKGWQLSTEEIENAFHAKVYPYDKHGFLYEVDLNQIEPFTFVINFNSNGTGKTGDFIKDRKSKAGNHSLPEFEVFLNSPNEVLYPSNTANIALSGEAIRMNCTTPDYCLNFTATQPGFLEGYIDINETGSFEPEIDVSLRKEFERAGKHCLPWNGLDAAENPVEKESVKVYASFGYSVMHFPIYDAEHNPNGFKVKAVRPANSPDPLIFWDDSEIETGTALDGLVNNSGCNSITNGCHKWENRGGFEEGIDIQETMNTWWYNKLLFETLTIDLTENSFEDLIPTISNLELTPSSCNVENGVALVEVSQDGKDYIFSWNSSPYSQMEVMTLGIGKHNLKVKAVGNSCIKDTSFQISSAGYQNLFTTTSEFCNSNNGTIQLNLSYPNTNYSWKDTSLTTLYRTNLISGEYGVVINNPASSSCRLDTTIKISKKEVAAEADFSYSSGNIATKVQPQKPVFFKNLSLSVDSCYWSFGDGNYSTALNPPNTYTNEGVYKVSLFIKNFQGCTGKVEKEITIERPTPCKALLPEAFSPNSDGINDNVGILGPAESIRLTIYNQWGEAVFYSENVQNRWDGTFRGNPVPSNSYPYVLNYSCIEPNGVKTSKSTIGEITLIR